ncbi:MAG: hypothetical protein JSR17_02055 [Proteobacteria bacterium]|nr:hypothetical protein [Pseudomonadota bacterium]
MLEGVSEEALDFSGATPLEKVNHILRQQLDYFSSDPTLLQTEGLLRVQGSEDKVLPVYNRMIVNPADPHSGFKNLASEPHNAIGVLKKSLKESLNFSPEAREIIEKLYQPLNPDEPLTPEKIIEELIAINALEEAKVVHNIFHLGYLVASQKEKNLMGPSNVAIVIAPWIDNIASDKNEDRTSPQALVRGVQRQPKIQTNLGQLLTAALTKAGKQESSKIAQPFEKAYPAQEAALQGGYRKKFPPQKLEPEKLSGNIVVRFFKAIWNGLKSIFSGDKKEKKEEKAALISTPAVEDSESKGINPAVKEKSKKHAKKEAKKAANVPKHLKKREKAVAHAKKHHSQQHKVVGELESKHHAKHQKKADKPRKK